MVFFVCVSDLLMIILIILFDRDDFRDYADLCFREFGSKVKHWITLNEPWSYSTGIFSTGIYSSKQCPKSDPDKCTIDFATHPYLAAHYQLLAHAAAAHIYRKKYQVFTSYIQSFHLE